MDRRAYTSAAEDKTYHSGLPYLASNPKDAPWQEVLNARLWLSRTGRNGPFCHMQ